MATAVIASPYPLGASVLDAQAGSINPTATTVPQTAHVRLLFASVFAPVWSSSLLISICFFLPAVLLPGCNTKTPHAPYEDFKSVSSVSEFFGAMIGWGWPHAFTLTVLIGTLVMILSRNPKRFRAAWLIYAVLIATIVFGAWYVEGQSFRSRSKPVTADQWIEPMILIVPTAAMLLVLQITYFNCRTWFAAAVWVQLALVTYALAWFLFLLVVFGTDLLMGGWLSLAASVVLWFSTIAERIRGLATLGFQARGARSATARCAPRQVAVISLQPVLR